ncbi:branched-chain amino acid ABC transporter permease [Methanocella sp. CWC-04]|uniref:Branched-chain amino acid ABC transporter permease n=1 Tax=Methanooceanicella nereidis TaxID=2052831 RepID=A0AAP2RBM4_9EURY|nr:AzlD domain-containing protein [Methanocella sp. CWC-04]MCD1293645.1 branched-chain amino acid ABC transporter permease [Methanocella sp. CWC-04]
MDNIWIIIICVALFTLAERMSFIMLSDRLNVPAWFKRGLKYVPPAVIAAIVFPSLFIMSGEMSVSLDNARMIAGLTAIVVAWKTRDAFMTIMAGMAVLWIISAI